MGNMKVDNSQTLGDLYKEFENDPFFPLSSTANEIVQLSKEGHCAKARLANFKMLGLNVAYILTGALEVPFKGAASAVGLVVTPPLMLTNRIVHLMGTDQPHATIRRSLAQNLPKAIDAFPTPLVIVTTIFKIVKLVIGLFSALTIGFISPKTHVRFMHWLGLLTASKFAEKDRKQDMVKSIEAREGNSLVESRKQILEWKVKNRTEQLLRQKYVGFNVPSADFWDAESELSKALIKATEDKRNARIKSLEKAEGRELCQDEIQKIKNEYWIPLHKEWQSSKKLESYQDFKAAELSNSLKESIQTKEWVTKEGRHFKSKDEQRTSGQIEYEAFMSEYLKWNLTETEVRDIQEKIKHKLNKEIDLFRAKAEKQIKEEEAEKRALRVENEMHLKAYDAAFKRAVEQQELVVCRPLTSEELREINIQTDAIQDIQRLITKLSIKRAENLSRFEVDALLIQQEADFTQDIKEELYRFAEGAIEHFAETREAAQKEATKRSYAMPVKHQINLHQMVMRELKRDYDVVNAKETEYQEKINVLAMQTYDSALNIAIEQFEKEQEKVISADELSALKAVVIRNIAANLNLFNEKVISLCNEDDEIDVSLKRELLIYSRKALGDILTQKEAWKDPKWKSKAERQLPEITKVGPDGKKIVVLPRERLEAYSLMGAYYETALDRQQLKVLGPKNKTRLDAYRTEEKSGYAKSWTQVSIQYDKEYDFKITFPVVGSSEKINGKPKRWGRQPQHVYTKNDLEFLDQEYRSVADQVAKIAKQKKAVFKFKYKSAGGIIDQERIAYTKKRFNNYLQDPAQMGIRKTLQAKDQDENTILDLQAQIDQLRIDYLRLKALSENKILGLEAEIVELKQEDVDFEDGSQSLEAGSDASDLDVDALTQDPTNLNDHVTQKDPANEYTENDFYASFAFDDGN
jgi:hypothetical protein